MALKLNTDSIDCNPLSERGLEGITDIAKGITGIELVSLSETRN